MNIGIIGTRRRDSWSDLRLVDRRFRRLYNDGDKVISGGCPEGGDRFAEMICKSYGIPIIIYYPRWNSEFRDGEIRLANYRRWAAFERNEPVARMSHVIIACVAPDRTGGTEDTIRKFIRECSKLFPLKYTLTEEWAIRNRKLYLV